MIRNKAQMIAARSRRHVGVYLGVLVLSTLWTVACLAVTVLFYPVGLYPTHWWIPFILWVSWLLSLMLIIVCHNDKA